MKKIFALFMAAAVLATTSFAQTKPEVKKATPAVKVVEKTKVTKTETPAKITAVKLKADGTPDKRFKENKAAAPAAVPLKADGTPDKRFKVNKKETKIQ